MSGTVNMILGMAQDFVRKVKPDDVRRAVDGAVNRCGSEDCDKLSPGVRCGCGRFVCLGHGYLTLEAPPKPICLECILELHLEPADEDEDEDED